MDISSRRAYVVFATCAILYFAPFLRVFSHNGDEGTLITAALRVFEGQLAFRDFFEVMGPGSFYWLALFFKLLGPTWFATRVSVAVTTLSISMVMYFLARRFAPDAKSASVGAAAPAVFLAAVLYHNWNAVSHHMDSTLFALASFAVLLVSIDAAGASLGRSAPISGPSVGGVFLAGFGAGVTTFFMLPKGLLLGGSFAVVLFVLFRQVCFRRSVAVLCAGYLLPIAAVTVWFWLGGGLNDLIYANWVWPLTNYSGVNRVPYGMEFRHLYWESFMTALRPVSPAPIAAATSGFLSLPFVTVMALPLLLAGLGLYYRKLAFSRETAPYWIVGLAIWISEMHRWDVRHIAFGSPILILLLFSLGRRVPNQFVQHARQLILASAVVLGLLNPLVALSASWPTNTRRGTAYDYVREHPILQSIEARVKPGDPLFVYPYSPMLYFLSGAENPTRYSILMYHINTPEQFREAVQSLETKRVRYVVWDKSFLQYVHNGFPTYQPPPPDEQIMEPYLSRHYRPISGDDDGVQILERIESPFDRERLADVPGLGRSN